MVSKLLALLAVILLVALVLLWRHHRRTIRKVAFAFDALDNKDFSFRFPDDHGSQQVLHSALNRIRTIMQNYDAEARERERYYEQIINSVDTGIIVADQKGNVLQHNRAALQLLGREALTHLVQTDGKLTQDRFAIHETQTKLKGKDVRIIAFSDISGELNNEEVDAWVKLTRVLTHEIMNTLTPVVSILSSGQPSEEGLQTIKATSEDLLHFVQSYRQFTHVPKPQPQLFYVKPFLERQVQFCGAQVSIVVEPRDLLLMADESLIARVVTNLLKNAIEANATEISIHAYTGASDSVIIDVSDQGELIPDDIAQHIFVPFFTTKPTGSGIGLSLSKQIMRVSGGNIALVQDAQENWVTFRLIFS